MENMVYYIMEMTEGDILVEHTHFCEICGEAFFQNTLQILYQRKNMKDSYGILELTRKNGIVPDFPTYNTMIGVSCSEIPIQVEFFDRLLDEMVFNGVFPEFKTYNTIFEGLYHYPQGRGVIKHFLWL